MRRIAGFMRLPAGHKPRFTEAALLLGAARIAVILLPFAWIAHVLNRRRDLTGTPLPPAQAEKAAQISAFIRMAATRLPWRCKCLERAIAAKLMLSWRGIPSMVSFGLRRDADASWKAHAWLTSGGQILTGRLTASKFNIVGTFGSASSAEEK